MNNADSLPDTLRAKLVAPLDMLGRQLHDLRISVMDRCNFRCPYCMPEAKYGKDFAFLPSAERLDFDEIVRLTRLAALLGLRKVRITGGEPLLRPNLAELISELRSIESITDIALTTNGVLLGQQAPALMAAGLNRVTISLDSLDPAVFSIMNGGRGELQRVLKGIRAAGDAGLTHLKVNTVVQRGVNDHTLLDMLDYFRGSGIVVRFIEFMDVGNLNHWSMAEVVPSAELLQQIEQRWPLEALPGNYKGEVAQRYRYRDGQGEIGFISSVTAPFCGACTRARISSDGSLYTCLFAERGMDLKTPLRSGASDEQLLDMMRNAWLQRTDRYSEERATPQAHHHKKIEMYFIGG
ncbi:cyclic pyranopterin phosphate synthase [Rhodanobacter sp. MP1X3]|jgi:GTP 3',8-cyclase|nr:cyclic pyranopterin phosphate synthase [Rhodanobacter sp. MP1X3]